MHTIIEVPAPTAVIAPRPEFLAEIAEADPAGVAVADGASEVTNLQLELSSNRLARILIGMGAGPGSPVVVALDPSIDSVIAAWAVLKSGAVSTAIATAGLAVQTRLIGVTTKANRDRMIDAVDWLVLDDLSALRRYAQVSDHPVADAERAAA